MKNHAISPLVDHRNSKNSSLPITSRFIARIAEGSTEDQLFLFENLHCADDCLVSTCAATGIGRLLEALNADGGHEILDAQHLVGKLFVDQRAVCERKELTIAVLFTKADDILFAHSGSPPE